MEQARAVQVSHTHSTPQAREAQVSPTPTTTSAGAAQVSHPHTPMKPRPPPLRQNSPFQAQWNRQGRSRFHTPPQQPRQGRSGFHAPLVLFCSREAPAIRAQHKPPARNTTRPPGPIGVGRSVAVALGFEPRVAVTPHSISSAAPSAARTRYLTRLLYYSHPLGTQIGHARWEQSHIRAPLAATVKHPHSRPPATVGIPHVRRPHPDSRSTHVDVTRRRTADPASFARASTTRTPHRPDAGHGFSPDSSRHAGYGLPCQGTYSTQ